MAPDRTPVPVPRGPVGLVLPNVGLDEVPRAEDLIALARDATAAGAGAVWTVDHLFWHTPLLDALTVLGLVAGALGDDAPSLGTAVLQPLLRPTPLLARELLSLHLATGGHRLIVGVGTGAHRRELAAMGIDDGDRPARLETAIGDLRALWAGEGAHRRYRIDPVVAPPAIWVGGSSVAARRRAARLGDGWFPMALDADELAAHLPALHAEVRAAGRDPDEVAVAVVVLVDVGPDPEVAVDRGTDSLARVFRTTRGAARGLLTAGRPNEVADEVRRLRDAGCDHVALLPVGDTRAVVDDLLPLLHDEAPR